jgi:hypothetical protein
MAERPVPSQGSSALRLEILKELQQLAESREYRDRLDRSPLAEAKGREHWVLHLLLRASEVETAHTDTLIGTAYSNIISRLQGLEDRLAHVEEVSGQLEGSVKARLESLDQIVGERVDAGLTQGTERLTRELGQNLRDNLDRKWGPIGESLETFAQGSKQLVKGVDDTFRLAAQSRLLLNDSVRRVSDLGRDLLALEDSLKLVVARTLEQGLAPLEHRLATIESQLGIAPPESPAAREPEKKGDAPQPSDA